MLTRQDPRVDFVWARVARPGRAAPTSSRCAGPRPSSSRAGGTGSPPSDDGVRLFIDNRRVIDQWHGPAGTEYDYVVDLGEPATTPSRWSSTTSGGGALAKLSWDSTPDQPGESFLAEYWNTPGAGRTAIPDAAADLARDEPAIDHDWGAGLTRPPVIGADHFVARWTRTLTPRPGQYEFTRHRRRRRAAVRRRGAVIDKWVDQGADDLSVELPLDSGPHTIVMEYYENGGGAVARMTYAQIGDLPESAGIPC